MARVFDSQFKIIKHKDGTTDLIPLCRSTNSPLANCVNRMIDKYNLNTLIDSVCIRKRINGKSMYITFVMDFKTSENFYECKNPFYSDSAFLYYFEELLKFADASR